MKKLFLFLFFLLLPFLVSARTAEFSALSSETFFDTVRERMLSGDRYFSVLAACSMRRFSSPSAILDAVYRFDDTDAGNDLDSLRENVLFQSVRVVGNRYSFCFYYLSTPEQNAFVAREVERILSGLELGEMNEAERAMAIVAWICRNVSYDGSSRTAFAALDSGGTNCVGYSVLAFDLLRGSGLNVKIVNGMDGDGIQHAWNLVEIGGQWYNLDVTWGDTCQTDT
jgi:transglutaminase-like putative cysteine protease